MGRPKKDFKVLNINLKKGIYEDLEQFCDETGISKTNAVEKMLEKCLNEFFKKNEEERKLI